MNELVTCLQCRNLVVSLDLEGMCSDRCRGERAAQYLVDRLTDAIEPFLAKRWSPYYSGEPGHCFDERPTFDDATFAKIEAAYDQIVAGAQQLIELALGRPVEMYSGLGWDKGGDFQGVYGGIDWHYPGEPTADKQDEAVEMAETPPARITNAEVQQVKAQGRALSLVLDTSLEIIRRRSNYDSTSIDELLFMLGDRFPVTPEMNLLLELIYHLWWDPNIEQVGGFGAIEFAWKAGR